MQSLQDQLSLLKQKQKSAPRLPYDNSQCSLLFDFKYSNQIELDTIYEIGYEGLLDLAKVDECFIKYLKLLFSSTSKYFNRDMIPLSEVNAYNEHLRHLIFDLSKYFNMKASHQVLEYLIKVYQINLHLCDEVLMTFLCYHQQPVFTKLMQNINYTEHSYWSFIEQYARNGSIIPRSAIVSYANSDVAFLMRLVQFYIDNIDISNEDYYLFVLDVVNGKIEAMNSVKPIEENVFQMVIKLVNKVHMGYYAGMRFNMEEKYTRAYVEWMTNVLNKVNLTAVYLQAIGNESVIRVLEMIESKNSVIGMIKYHALLCLKYTLVSNGNGNNKVYKVEALRALSKKGLLFNSVIDYIRSYKKDIEYFIYQLIVSSGIEHFDLVKGILSDSLKEEELIERVIGLLMKYNQMRQYVPLLEELNVNMFNKVFINMVNKKSMTASDIASMHNSNRTSYGVYFDLISSSISQVLKGIKECDDKAMIIDDSIQSALRSKFDFYDDEIVLSAILNMKSLLYFNSLTESILSFYNSIKKGKDNKFSQALIKAIEKHLDKSGVIDSNETYYLYRAVFFNVKEYSGYVKPIPLHTIINAFIDIMKYQPECNKQLNQTYVIAYIKDAIASSDLSMDNCDVIQSLLNTDNLLKYYPQIAKELYSVYIQAISKSKVLFEDKLALISNLILYTLKHSSQFKNRDLDVVLSIAFREQNTPLQLYLAYLLFNNHEEIETKETLSTQLLEYVANKIKDEKEIECLLLLALMLNLPSMSNDAISTYFNPKSKLKIIYSPLYQMNTNAKYSTSKDTGKYSESSKDKQTQSIKTLISLVYSNKSELCINIKCLNRLLTSNSQLKTEDKESIYLLLSHLLLRNYNKSHHKASIQLLSLFNTNTSYTQCLFNKEHKQSLLTYIQSVNEDPQLECLLLSNFIQFYPKSQIDVMLFYKDKTMPNELIEAFFDSGISIEDIKTPQMLFQIIAFALRNNVSPYTLNITLSMGEGIMTYFNYINKNKSTIKESQLVYFIKMIMFTINTNTDSNTSNKAYSLELIMKVIDIINSNATEDININFCYAIYSLSKRLSINSNDPNSNTIIGHISKSIESLFKILCNSITLSNVINYEQEKKIQLLLNASNYLTALYNIDNTILIKLSDYINSTSAPDSLSLVSQKEINAILLQSILEYINLIAPIGNSQSPDSYFAYVKCIILYSDIANAVLKELSSNVIMTKHHQCRAYFSYHLYSKYANIERNEILTGFILAQGERTMFQWMKLIEEIIKLNDTDSKVVNDLIGYIIAFVLKISKWTNANDMTDIDDDNGNSDRDSCTIILNIISLLFNTSSIDLMDKMLLFAKKNNLLSSLLISLYTPNESLSLNYSKSKNYMLSKLIQLIPDESLQHNDLFFFIVNTVILGNDHGNNKEKKIENLIFLYQLLTRITNKKLSIDKLKESLPQIISKVSMTKRHIGHIVYLLSISKLLLTIFNIYTINFLTLINSFIPLHITVLNESIAFISNKDIKLLIIETMDLLTHDICVFLSPFLTQLLQCLIQFTMIEEETKAVLIKIGAKNIFDSSFECIKANHQSGVMNALLLTYFNASINSADGLIIADLGSEVMNFFITILLSNQMLYENIKDCIKNFVLKMHGKQLKIIFEDILLKTLKTKDEYKEYQLKTSIVVFQIFNVILGIIKDLFIKNYFLKYKGVLIQLLNTSNAMIFAKEDIPVQLGKKRQRPRNDSDDNDNGFSYYKLSCLLLENIRLNFKYSKGELLAETIEELYEPVLNQFKLTESIKDMSQYYDEAVKGCIYEMFKNSKNDELIGKFDEELLDLLREDNYVTRLFVLKTVLYLFETMKERYISFIEEVIQCVSERLEDSNELVQGAAREVIKAIEKLTGESYATYLE